jgi:hypothetical protein
LTWVFHSTPPCIDPSAEQDKISNNICEWFVSQFFVVSLNVASTAAYLLLIEAVTFFAAGIMASFVLQKAVPELNWHS